MRHAEVRRRDRMAEIEKFAAENEIPVQNAQLLNTALTHTSYANEHKNEVIHDNERLGMPSWIWSSGNTFFCVSPAGRKGS